LHSSKTQLFSFQSLPHSLPKTPGGGVRTPLIPPSSPLVHNGQLPVQPRFSTSHGSPVTSLPAVHVLFSPFCRRIAHSSRLGGRHE
jgi:hypothetical protein